MFEWFKKRIKKQKQISIILNNNDVIVINGRKYLVGFLFKGNDIYLHDVDKYL